MDIDLNSSYTILVLMTGMLVFTIVNYCQPGKIDRRLCSADYGFEVNISLVYLSVAVMVASIYADYKYIIDFAGSYGVGGDFFECLVQYKAVMTFSDASEILVPSPWYRNVLMILSTVAVYLFVYLFFRDLILHEHVRYSYCLIIVLYIAYSLMGGSRSNTFRLITAMLFLWGYFKEINIKTFNPKYILIKILMIVVLVAILFVLFIVVVGRTNSDFDIEYVIMQIFIYAAAPIFNLDIYIENPWSQTHGIWGELTFIRGINWIGTHFNISSWQYPLDLPFLSYHGFELGNVYTTFYAFYYDFGYIGVCILSIIMAIVAFWCYHHVYTYKEDESIKILWVTSYAYLINDLIMLPFSNRFYETISSPSSWYCIFTFFCVIKIYKSIKNADLKCYGIKK